MTRRDVVDTALVGAGLIAVAYLTPARARPGLALATAVLLSRQHGEDRKRLERTILRLFEERRSIHRRLSWDLEPRIDTLERGRFVKADAPARAPRDPTRPSR